MATASARANCLQNCYATKGKGSRRSTTGPGAVVGTFPYGGKDFTCHGKVVKGTPRVFCKSAAMVSPNPWAGYAAARSQMPFGPRFPMAPASAPYVAPAASPAAPFLFPPGREPEEHGILGRVPSAQLWGARGRGRGRRGRW
jgi:hypothetical protein